MASVDPKIIDLMNAHKGEEPWVALEYFPPRTASGVENLKARLPRMKREATPMYVDVTWGAGGTTADATMDITIAAKRDFGLIPNMHLTCTNIEEEKVKEALETCKREGITNIVALRGDAPAGQEKWEATEGGFACGMDLVKFIRDTYGDHFGISVAGYPEGHPDKIKTVTGGFDSLSESEKRRCSVQVADDGTETLSVCSDADFAVEMAYLKSKIDAGADFIITQMFFDVQVYADFCKECVACGINVPVVPGIMCLNAYGGFKKMGIMCKTRVPEKLTAKMEELKDDKDAIKAYGSEFGAEMSRELKAVGAPGLHYYCLNLEIVVMGILDRLNMRTPSEPAVSVDPKIIDLMKAHKGEDPWVALEYFPPRTASGVENLKAKLPRMKREATPMYVDVTWGAGGTTADATMDITIAAKRDFGLIPNMHLTCTNIEAEKVKEALETCKREGITNIVALRGDAPAGQDKWEATEGGFNCGMDLVAFIRQNYGDHFGISVAGYPEGHPDKIKTVTGGFDSLSESEKRRCSVQVADDGTETLSVCSDADFAVEMTYLKAKVDAGADFIITQMFFDVQVYADFCKECVACGINVPVVPGIMCLNAYGGFKKMGIMCKTRVPEKLTAAMEERKDDKDAIKAYGSEFGAEMSRELLAVGAPGLHYYCLNLEIVTMGILDRLNLRTVLSPPVPKGPAAEHRVADLTLSDFGRKEIEQAEYEMPGLMSTRAEYGPIQPLANCRIAGSLHMTIQTAVLIETLQYLGGDMRWCSCNIFSTQDHAAAAVVQKGTASVFAWKGETLEEYWECTMNALFWADDDGKGRGPDMIVDDGGDMTLLVHEGVKAEKAYTKDGAIPDPATTDNAEMKIVLGLLAQSVVKDATIWHTVAARIEGVSEETTTGVHRLYQMQENGELLFPCINVNDSVTKSKFDNLYGCKHSLPDGLCRATDVMLAGKKVLVCGYGDVGKGCAFAMKGAGCITYVTEIDPICALQASMEGFPVVKFETVMSVVDIVVTTTGNKDIIRVEHMAAMKNNAIVSNIGHFDNEIQMEALEAATTRTNIKPQVDKFVFPDGHGVIVLAEGRLMNLGCATGHPSFVMSCSFTNQTVAQIELWTERNSGKYAKGKVYVLPKVLDEKVARLHLGQLGVELTPLTTEQAGYISVPMLGPYKPDTYRY